MYSSLRRNYMDFLGKLQGIKLLLVGPCTCVLLAGKHGCLQSSRVAAMDATLSSCVCRDHCNNLDPRFFVLIMCILSALSTSNNHTTPHHNDAHHTTPHHTTTTHTLSIHHLVSFGCRPRSHAEERATCHTSTGSRSLPVMEAARTVVEGEFSPG